MSTRAQLTLSDFHRGKFTDSVIKHILWKSLDRDEIEGRRVKRLGSGWNLENCFDRKVCRGSGNFIKNLLGSRRKKKWITNYNHGPFHYVPYVLIKEIFERWWLPVEFYKMFRGYTYFSHILSYIIHISYINNYLLYEHHLSEFPLSENFIFKEKYQRYVMKLTEDKRKRK